MPLVGIELHPITLNLKLLVTINFMLSSFLFLKNRKKVIGQV